MPETLLPPVGHWRKMGRDEINACPQIRYEGEIRIATTPAEASLAAEELRLEILLGFDIETKPVYRKGVNHLPSLLQLAGSNVVYLFQLRRTRIPKELKKILSDPFLVKTGVAIRDDIAALERIEPFKNRGFADLAMMAKTAGIKNHGLRGLAAVLLGGRIAKTNQCSDWSRQILTPAQIHYAATDAWISRELYIALEKILAVNRL